MVKTKRKSSDSDGITSKSKKRKESDIFIQDDSTFASIINKAGYLLTLPGKNNELVKDQAVFQRDLARSIKRHQDYPEVVTEFVEGLSEHLQDVTQFVSSLMPTCTSAECDASARGGNQDSLIRLLLGVDSIQAAVMNLLLEKLAEFTEDEDVILDSYGRVNFPKLIMTQFKWLDRIVDSKEVTQKMLDILCIVSPEAQREIISTLPEVVDDSEHGPVARQLKDLLVKDNQLASPILDALSNLNLKVELLTEVRRSVIESLPSVSLDELPVVIKFLLQTLSDQDAVDIIKEIRGHLDFNTSVSSRSGKGNARSSEALSVDALKSGIRFQKCIADAWLKAIQSVRTSGDHKVIDLFVLFILHTHNYKKAVESLVRNKIRGGLLTENLLHNTFTSHSQVLRDYFPSILSLAEVLLRSPEPLLAYFASAIYKHTFTAFDTYCKQEIVGNLVMHIGSGSQGEVDSAVQILDELVQEQSKKMAPFAIFVKGIVDYLDNLSMAQIRKLYSMLITLAFRTEEGQSLIQDDLHILIRKQLSNNTLKYKRMGVLGAIMVVKSMACQRQNDMSDSDYKQIINLLQLVRNCSTKSPKVAALFMDELAAVMFKENLDSQIKSWISEQFINDFQDDYVVDIESDQTIEAQGLPLSSRYGLDDESESSIAINLSPLVSMDDCVISEERPVSIFCLASHFRLLSICEYQQHNGLLEGIDALLGCSLYLPDPTLVDKLSSMNSKEKSFLILSLFHTVNWFTEVINAFASQTDTEMKAKVVTRLQNITDLLKVLDKCLIDCPNFQLPLVTFDCEESSQTIKSGGSSTSGAKKAKKPVKGKKGKDSKEIEKDADDESDESRDTTMLEKTQEEKEGKSESSVIDRTKYKPYFRELDLDVFKVLNIGLITKAALDTEMNTKEETVLQLHPPQLEYLLEDLVRKLDHSLIASVVKRKSFLKAAGTKTLGFSHLDALAPHQVAKQAVKLLPALCGHLEDSHSFFQQIIKESDGILDGPGMRSEEAFQMGSCYHLVLQVFLSLFSWTGFRMAEHRDMLKEALAVFVERLDTNASSQASFQDLVVQTSTYLENLSSTLPNLSAAVTLVKLLCTLSDKIDSDDIKAKIRLLSKQMLKREWYGPDGERDKGSKHNDLIQQLLKLYLHHCEDVLAALENIAAVGIPELLEAEKNGCSNTYPTLTRNSFPYFYRVVLMVLVDTAKGIDAGQPDSSDEVKLDRLFRWNLAVRVFHIQVNLIKAFDGRSNLNSILKYSRQFIEVFVRQCMPLLDRVFRSHREDVQGLLKNVQLSTRTLHHICGHSKIVKDVTLTNQVPLLKKCLETFVYRVKAMLTLNKCLEAFWLGNLKNRDLQGEEILSQSVDESTKGDDSDSDSLPDDDDDDESDEDADKKSEPSVANEESDDSDSGGESYSEKF